MCNGVTSIGLATLAQLRRLRVLELSYTEVQVRLCAALIAKLEALFQQFLDACASTLAE